MAKANADAVANAQTNGSLPVSSQAQEMRSSPQMPNQGLKKPVEIRLDEATEADGEGEEEIEHVQEGEEEVVYEEEYEEEEEDLEVSSTFGEYGGERASYSPSSFSGAASPEVVLDGEDDPESDPHFQSRRSLAGSNSDDELASSPPQRCRKRSCDVLEDGDLPRELRRKKEGTPPKRARKGDGTMDPRPAATLAIAGRTNRMRKRNSEELRDDDDDDTLSDSEFTKRTNAARRGRGNTSLDERSGDTTGPHKRVKIGYAGRDSDEKSRVQR